MNLLSRCVFKDKEPYPFKKIPQLVGILQSIYLY